MGALRDLWNRLRGRTPDPAAAPSYPPVPSFSVSVTPRYSRIVLIVLIVLLALLGFLLFSDDFILRLFGLVAFRAATRMYLGVAFLVLAALFLGVLLFTYAEVEEESQYGLILLACELFLLGCLLAAAVAGSLTPARAGILALLGSLALLFAGRFVHAVSNGDPPRVESHWGGLGGTMGGWTVSPSMVFLAAALTLGLLVALMEARLPEKDEEDPGKSVAADSAAARPREGRAAAARGGNSAAAQRPAAVDSAAARPPAAEAPAQDSAAPSPG